MTTEYWLQKKTIGGWSHVTWYDDLIQATENFNRCSAGNSGYSWRVVKSETVVEKMLDDSTPIEASEIELTYPQVKDGVNNGWLTRDEALKRFPPVIKPRQPVQDAPKSSGWGGTASGWGNSIPIDAVANEAVATWARQSLTGGHGLSGSVWLVHHGKKHKTRVAADKVAAMMAEGYVKGGPATRFE